MSMQVDTERLERVLAQLDDVRRDFSDEEQALFAALMREGLRAQLPAELVSRAEAEAEAAGSQNASAGQASDEVARKVADSIMTYRDGLSDAEDKRLVDSIISDAAAPDDEAGDEVEGHYWVFKWDIGAPTSSALYTFYNGMCRNSGFGRSTYLQANFGTFWTHYRCYVWY